MSAPVAATEIVLAERYRVLAELGRGEMATTYLVEDTRPAEAGAGPGPHGAAAATTPPRRLVLKRFSVREALGARGRTTLSLGEPDALKLVELFEREGRILAELRHPRIPRLVDFITRESPDDVELFLVQEHVAGKSLADLARAGRHFREAEIVAMGAEIARVLGDLHALRPPIVHRDVKPSNILRRDDDGALFLIDFGAVKHRVGSGGLDEATVVGTLGYMPLEQLEGRASPASDVHALGATLVALLTGRAPHELPKVGLRPDFRKVVAVSDGLARVLDAALAPDPSARYLDGTALAADLDRVARGQAPLGPAATTSAPPAVASAPAGSRAGRRRGLVAMGLVAGIAIAVLFGRAQQSIERLGHRTTTVPDRGPVPFAKAPSPLPMGPPTIPVAPFFTRYEAEGLVTHLAEDGRGDVWAAIERAQGIFVRFVGADPARPVVVAAADAPAKLVAAATAFRKDLTRAPVAPDLVELLSRELPGIEISAAARTADDRLWVASAHAGLHLREGGLWYRMTEAEGLPSDQVQSLVVDRRGGLWVASYPTVLHAREDEAARRIKTVPRVGSRAGTVFENAAHAVEKLLADRRTSGGVAWRRTVDHTLVFFDGRLIAPAPRPGFAPDFLGHMRGDGRGATLHQGRVAAWDDKGLEQALPALPELRGWHGAVFVDARGTVFVLGDQVASLARESSGRGVGRFATSWTVHAELGGLGVRDAAEDRQGRLWLATRQGSSGTLHGWNGQDWQHVACKRREHATASLAIEAMAPLGDGRFALALGPTPTAPIFDPDRPDGLDCNTGLDVPAWWSRLRKDSQGRQWLLTSAGLLVKDGNHANHGNHGNDANHGKDAARTRTLGARDGIVAPRNFTFDGDGRLWILGGDGRVGAYDPALLLAGPGGP